MIRQESRGKAAVTELATYDENFLKDECKKLSENIINLWNQWSRANPISIYTCNYMIDYSLFHDGQTSIQHGSPKMLLAIKLRKSITSGSCNTWHESKKEESEKIF
jgi:hypothetical protein